MSAFDSAMLMIEDMSKQIVELEQQVWELQLAVWHERKDPREGVCGVYERRECSFCLTAQKAYMHVEEMLHNED